MQVGDLVTLKKEWVDEIFLGVVTQVWGAGFQDNNVMCQVDWNKDMGLGLHFQDELEVISA